MRYHLWKCIAVATIVESDATGPFAASGDRPPRPKRSNIVKAGPSAVLARSVDGVGADDAESEPAASAPSYSLGQMNLGVGSGSGLPARLPPSLQGLVRNPGMSHAADGGVSTEKSRSSSVRGSIVMPPQPVEPLQDGAGDEVTVEDIGSTEDTWHSTLASLRDKGFTGGKAVNPLLARVRNHGVIPAGDGARPVRRAKAPGPSPMAIGAPEESQVESSNKRLFNHSVGSESLIRGSGLSNLQPAKASNAGDMNIEDLDSSSTSAGSSGDDDDSEDDELPVGTLASLKDLARPTRNAVRSSRPLGIPGWTPPSPSSM